MLNYFSKNQIKLAPIFFLAPAGCLFLLYVIYPIVDSIWVSFHQWNGMDRGVLGLSGEYKNWNTLSPKFTFGDYNKYKYAYNKCFVYDKCEK